MNSRKIVPSQKHHPGEPGGGKEKQAAVEEDDEQVVQSIASDESDQNNPKTSKGLRQWALEKHSASPSEVGQALKARGMKEFDPARWEDMKQAIADF